MWFSNTVTALQKPYYSSWSITGPPKCCHSGNSGEVDQDEPVLERLSLDLQLHRLHINTLNLARTVPSSAILWIQLCLRSSTSNLLDIRPSRCVTVGDRSFATAVPRLWNSLPADVRSASSLTTFRRKLKTHLFRQSYPDIVLQLRGAFKKFVDSHS